MRFSLVAASVTLSVSHFTLDVAANGIAAAKVGSASQDAGPFSQLAAASPDSEATPDSPQEPFSLPLNVAPLVQAKNLTSVPAIPAHSPGCAPPSNGSPVIGTPAKPAGQGAVTPPSFVPGDTSSGKCLCPPPPPACPGSAMPPAGPAAHLPGLNGDGALSNGTSTNRVVDPHEPNAPSVVASPTPANDSLATDGGSGDWPTSAAMTIARGSSLITAMILAISAVLY